MRWSVGPAEDTDTEALAAFYAAVIEGLSVQAQDGATQSRLQAIGDIAMSAWPSSRLLNKSPGGR